MSTEHLVAPAIHDLVATYLRAKLTPTSVTTKTPQAHPTQFVVVIRTGGAGRSDLIIQEGNVLIEAWADNDEDASDLIRNIDGYMHSAKFDHTNTIRDVVTIGDATEQLDPDSSQARYVATYAVTVRAVVQ